MFYSVKLLFLLQEDVVVAGRICCDSVGRMNSKSIVLEGSRETSGGQRIQLDLMGLKNYSLFPGQVLHFCFKLKIIGS